MPDLHNDLHSNVLNVHAGAQVRRVQLPTDRPHLLTSFANLDDRSGFASLSTLEGLYKPSVPLNRA